MQIQDTIWKKAQSLALCVPKSVKQAWPFMASLELVWCRGKSRGLCFHLLGKWELHLES